MKKLFLTALAMAMIAGAQENMFAMPRANVSEYKPPKDLPRWDVNGHALYAKNEKDAIKYAKKRGYWKKGTVATKLSD